MLEVIPNPKKISQVLTTLPPGAKNRKINVTKYPTVLNHIHMCRKRRRRWTRMLNSEALGNTFLVFYLLNFFRCSLDDPFLWQVSSKQALSIPTLTFVRTRKLTEIRLLTRCLEISIVGVAIGTLLTAHFSLADCLVTYCIRAPNDRIPTHLVPSTRCILYKQLCLNGRAKPKYSMSM